MDTLHQALILLRENRWHEAHTLAQSDTTLQGAWLHGILHLQEGDLENAEYWYGKAGRDFRNRGPLAEELDRLEKAL